VSVGVAGSVEDCELLEGRVEWECFGVAQFLLLSVERCGNEWNGMKGMGVMFLVMLKVSGDVVGVRGVCYIEEL
jgi:hypothetical protein